MRRKSTRVVGTTLDHFYGTPYTEYAQRADGQWFERTYSWQGGSKRVPGRWYSTLAPRAAGSHYQRDVTTNTVYLPA